MHEARRARFLLAACGLALFLFLGFRAGLAGWRWDELRELGANGVLQLFVRGFRQDAVVVSGLFAPLALGLALLPDRWLACGFAAARVWCALAFVLLWFAEIAGVHFFRTYDFRPNYLVVEHGADREVLGTVMTAYPVFQVAAGTLLGAALLMLLLRRLAPVPAAPLCTPPRQRVLSLLLLPLFALGMRGTLDHRAINPSAAAFCDNRLANELAGNGLYNVAYHLAQHWKGTYPKLAESLALLPPAAAEALARAHLGVTGRFTHDSRNPLVRLEGEGTEPRPLNVVVVVMESFTARLVGHLGGELALTPELDALARSSVVLADCRATGERTIQGLEALLCSFPPLPGVSVVRRPEAQGGFFTLATALEERGYATLFVYGGQGIFDHMSGFFLDNGYDRFIEEKDFDDPLFRGEWGVCDEDLFARVVAEADRLHSAGRPFFATALTVSLHSPWQYPDGRVEPLPADTRVPAGFEREELDTFRYADHAIGRFMAAARARPWYDDTLFVFAGDHGVHLRGQALVPADEYRVPVFFHCPKVLAPRRVEAVTSQLDVAPSIMGVLGGPHRSTFFGRDVVGHPERAGFALMIYKKRRYAVANAGRVAVLPEWGGSVPLARGDGESDTLPSDLAGLYEEDRRLATALCQTADQLLRSAAWHVAPRR